MLVWAHTGNPPKPRDPPGKALAEMMEGSERDAHSGEFVATSLTCLSITTSFVKMRIRFKNEKWYVWPLGKEARFLGSRTQENSQALKRFMQPMDSRAFCL